MKEIKKIVIKGRSGYGFVDHAYVDNVTITPKSIAYYYKPYQEDPKNPSRKWKYQSSTPEFKKQFETIAGSLQEILADPPKAGIFYSGTVEFNITYSDKTKYKMSFPLILHQLHDLFMNIKMMVPFIEMIPPTLWTEEDEEDYKVPEIYHSYLP